MLQNIVLIFLITEQVYHLHAEFCVEGCRLFENNGAVNSPNPSRNILSLNALLATAIDAKHTTWLNKERAFKKKLQNPLIQENRNVKGCSTETLQASVDIYYQLIKQMHEITKPFITRIILDDEDHQSQLFSTLLQTKVNQSSISSNFIIFKYLTITNYHTLPGEIMSAISKASTRESSLNILLTGSQITELLIQSRIDKFPDERNDFWLVPNVKLVNSRRFLTTMYFYTKITCNNQMDIKPDHVIISRIEHWTVSGFKLLYNIHLNKKGRLTIVSSAFKHGKVKIPVATLIAPPFLFLEQVYNDFEIDRRMECRVRATTNTSISGQSDWEYHHCFGYLVDLLLAISKELHLHIDLYIVEEGQYGQYNITLGNYTTGLLGDVINNKAVIGLGALTITQKRMKFFEFTKPFMVDSIDIITLKETTVTDVSEFNLFTNLDSSTQYSILGFYIASVIFVYVAENYLQLMKRIFTVDRIYLGIKMLNYDFRDCILYITGLLVQRDLGAKNPTTIGGRIISLTFAFGMVSITTLYTASLTYQQVIHRGYQEFKGLKDERVQHPTPTFKLASLHQGFLSDIFQASSNPMMKRLYLFMKEYNTEDMSGGVQSIVLRNIDAYFIEDSFARYYTTQEGQCNLHVHPTDLPTSNYGFALQKGSPLSEDISLVITKLLEDGSLQELYKRWIDRRCSSTRWKSTEKLHILFFKKLFFGLFAAILFSLLVIGLEYLYSRLQRDYDLTWNYQSRNLRGMLEEHEILKKWLIMKEEKQGTQEQCQ